MHSISRPEPIPHKHINPHSSKNTCTHPLIRKKTFHLTVQTFAKTLFLTNNMACTCMFDGINGRGLCQIRTEL